MSFGDAAERGLGEGHHAALHRTNLRAPNHTEAYDSVERRMGELKQQLELGPGLFEAIAEHLQRARSTSA